MIKDPTLMSPEAHGYAAYPGGHAEGYPDTFAQLFEDFYGYGRRRRFRRSPPISQFPNRPRRDDLVRRHHGSANERKWVNVEYK